MGLGSALTRLHADRAVDSAVRDVLLLFHDHPRQRMPAEDVAGRTGRQETLVASILRTLAETFVLDCDGDPPSYRYVPDAVLELDIRRYLDRVEHAHGRLQDNVARFRQRQGYR